MGCKLSHFRCCCCCGCQTPTDDLEKLPKVEKIKLTAAGPEEFELEIGEGSKFTRFVFISDTHNQHKKIDLPEGDVLVLTGDFSKWKRAEESIKPVNEWLGTLSFAHKIVICGNHETAFDPENPEQTQSLLSNATYLQDSFVTINGLKIYGLPWHRRRGCLYRASAFGLHWKELSQKCSQIPPDVDLLLSHPPPFGVLDHETAGHVGPLSLLEAVRRVRPKLHVFGHCHFQRGLAKIEDLDQTIFMNAANSQAGYVAPAIRVKWKHD